MKLSKIFTAVAVVTLMGIALSGCGKPHEPVPKLEDVTGKWVAMKKEAYKLGGGQQVGFVIEFFSDKTVSLPAGKGTWDLMKDGRVEIEISAMTMSGVLQGNKLTVTMPENQGTVIFQKQ